ncbi:MAG: hypothetical protein ACYC5V_08615 [Gemmatimonadaceae bacterium]
MRRHTVSVVVAGIAVVLASAARAQAPAASDADRFFANVAGLCGKAFGGRVVANQPTPSAADPFEGKTLVFHVRRCSKDRLELPFHVGDDRSRTWVLTRVGRAISLKHDHRHRDGASDSLTMYGGVTSQPGTTARQEFPADAESRDLFTRLKLQVSLPNVWAMEIEPDRRFVYELARPGRLFRVEFDLTREVPVPPAPWGHEGK